MEFNLIELRAIRHLSLAMYEEVEAREPTREIQFKRVSENMEQHTAAIAEDGKGILHFLME